MKYRSEFMGGLWAVSCLLWARLLATKLYDYDLWWHLSTGRAMVQTHQFLRTDIFSHTLEGHPWVNFEWLSQILLYGVWHIGGFPLLFVGKILMSFAVLGALVLLMNRLGARGPLLLFMTWVAFFSLRTRLYERVELVTLLMMPLVIWLFLSKRPRFPLILALLTLAWCNLHGGFIYGIGITFLFVVGSRFANLPKDQTALIDRGFVAMLAASLINPHGPFVVTVFSDHLAQLSSGPAIIQEWMPFSVKDQPMFWIQFCAAGFFMVRALLKKDRDAKFWIPAVLVFLLWGSRYFRNAALASVVAIPFIAGCLAREKLKWIPKAATIAILVLIITMAPVFAKPLPDGLVHWSRTPKSACDFVQKNGIHGKMFNAYEYGGYISWALGPVEKVFADGRYIFQPLMVEFNRLIAALFESESNEGWVKFWDDHRIDYAICTYMDLMVPAGRNQAPFPTSPYNAMFPRATWALVYWDDASLVFLKRTPAFKSFIAENEYTALWPYNFDQMSFMLKQGAVPVAQAIKELERHKATVGFTVTGAEIEKRVF